MADVVRVVPAPELVTKLDRRSAERSESSVEQERAIRARQPVVALSAGAGSGKTRVLVERFIHLVQNDGVSPLRILAITFTEKAAAEMKERIVRSFEKLGDETNRRLAEAAYISTIHGFCSRLLRENPLAARLDTAFQVMDDLTRSIFLDEQLERLYADDWFVEHERRFGKRFQSERPCLFELIEEAAFLPSEFGTREAKEAAFSIDEHVEEAGRRIEAWRDARWAEARETLLDAEGLFAGLTVSGPASIRDHAQLLEIIAALRANPARDATLAESFCKATGFTRGVKDKDAAGEVKDVFEVVRPIFKDASSPDLAERLRIERERIAPIKHGIYERARALRDGYGDFKRRHGYLDFDDMQQRALDLLEDDAVRREYAGTFSHILLDEAQDANGVQMRIIDRLRDGQPGLFMVGDVKQSIYGFRGADVRLFHERHGDAGAGALSLLDNYRSRAGVLGVVNEVGALLWRDAVPAFVPLVPKFDYLPAGSEPHVELRVVEQCTSIGADGKEKPERADDVREREAIALAAWIRDVVEGDESQALFVHDTKENRMRRVRYGDIALLTRSRTPFPAFEHALADFGIPFVKYGGRGFFSGGEVQDILAALRVIANPLDDISLLAALRSPLFGWGDADLVRLRRAAEKRALWYALAGGMQPVDEMSVRDAHATLARLRRYATLVPPTTLIEMICEATSYRAALLCQPRGRAQVANLDKLVEFARATEALDGPSLASFVHRATLAERYLGNEPGASAVTSAGDDVVLSTIHGSKGLEWPVVILAALDTDFARSDSGSRYSAPDGALLLQPTGDDGKPIKPLSNESLIDLAKARDEAEAKRLFYVGMTRARERLILSGRHRYAGRSSDNFKEPLAWLLDALKVSAPEESARVERLGHAPLLLDCISPARVEPLRDAARAFEDRALAAAREAVRAGRPVDWPTSGSGGDRTAAADVSRIVERVLGGDRPAWAMRRPLATTTVTQLVYFFKCPLVYNFDLVLQIDEHPRLRGRAGERSSGMTALDFGTCVHELLERAELHAPPDAEARRLAGERTDLGDADRAKIESLLANVLGSPLLDRARTATRIEREYPFYLELDGTTVQGVIDLVFSDADGRGVVVDYKSNDLAAPDRLRVLSELYRPQIELYALAAKRAKLVDPTEATLYFLNRSQAQTVAVDGQRLDAVESRTRDALGRIARGDWDTEPGEKCRGCGYRARGFCEVGKRFRE